MVVPIMQDRCTATYLRELDVHAIEQRGCDFLSPQFSPERLGKPLEEIDRVRDYDFEHLARVERRLQGVNRRVALGHIFEEITHKCQTNTEKHIAVARFLHKAGHHGILQPVYPDGSMVHDPLVLLELGEMKCGHVATVAVDLFEAAGMEGRCVALGGHVITEIHYDGAWHYLDANLFGNGETVFNADGCIPSVRELSHQPESLDALASHFALVNAPRMSAGPCPSEAYFTKPDEVQRFYYRKAPPNAGEPIPSSQFYGWDRLQNDPADWEINDYDSRCQPSAVKILEVKSLPPEREGKKRLNLRWSQAKTKNNPVLGYRVFLSDQSRGWNYGTFAGSKDAEAYWSSRQGWKCEMYDALYCVPPHEIALIEIPETQVELELDAGATYFVSIMPFAVHHEKVGKKLYYLSNELKITAH